MAPFRQGFQNNWNQPSQPGGYNYQQYAPVPNQGYMPNGGTFANQFNGYGNGQPYKKQSGCKVKDSYKRNGGRETVNAICVTGWSNTRSCGFCSFVAIPCNDSDTKNERWKKMVVSIFPKNGVKITTNGLWDMQKKRLKMPNYRGGMVADPYAPNGGYWGEGGHPISKNRLNQGQNRR